MPAHQVNQVNQADQIDQIDDIDQADEALPAENICRAVQNSDSVYGNEIELELYSLQQNPRGPCENEDPRATLH
ncbi:Hypothetical predicted protein [Octopus vulgaris]|uniref:Uncharacterized protein n=2 Tax=Octopus TaxID=6643 RepID=A0AA36BCZ4_OCTVU|nr:Hypothetical predicted protein [Octopus vulgaris]